MRIDDQPGETRDDDPLGLRPPQPTPRPRRLWPRLRAPLAAAATVLAVVAGIALLHSPASRPSASRPTVGRPTAARSAVRHGAASAPRSARATRARATTDGCPKVRHAAFTVYDGDGSRRWSRSLPTGGPVSESSATPLVVGGLVYVGATGFVYAYNVASGHLVWKQHVGSSIYAFWAAGGALVVDVDQVSDHATMQALGLRSGVRRWSYTVPGFGFVGDAAPTGDGGLAFLVLRGKRVIVLDLADGRVRWQTTAAQLGTPISDAPVSAGRGLVFVVGQDGTLTALDARSGGRVWRGKGVDPDSVGVISDGLYLSVPIEFSGPTSTVLAFSLATGSHRWDYHPTDLFDAYADPRGFRLLDSRRETLTLLGTAGHAIWTTRLRHVSDIDQPSATTDAGRVVIVLEDHDVAFVDDTTGAVHRAAFPGSAGDVGAAGLGADAVVAAAHTVTRVSRAGVRWTSRLPQDELRPPVALGGGDVGVATEDPLCLSATASVTR